MTTIDLGDPLPNLSVNIYDTNGALANAGAVTLTVTLPDGTTSTPTVSNASTGVYTASYVPTQTGRHVARWAATGANQSAFTTVYNVNDPTAAIVGLADAQAFLGMYSAADQDVVRSVVEAATGIVERYTNQTWRRQTVTAEKHAGGKCALQLRKHPASSITTVVENGATLAADEYTYDATSGLLWRGDGTTGAAWFPGPNAVAVTYVAGASDVPDEVVEAVLGTARSLVEERRGGARQMADEYAQPSDLIPRRHRLALSSYVLPAF